MMKKLFLSTLLLCLSAGSVYASPILVTINEGSTFFDGTSLSGSFYYDAATDEFSGVNLTTDSGFMLSCSDVGIPGDFTCDDFAPSGVSGYTYDFGVPVSGTNENGTPIAEPNMFGFLLSDFLPDQNIQRGLFLSFAGPLTGGTIAMNMTEYFCGPDDCTFRIESTLFRTGTGSVSVPEPGTLGLLGLGLFGLAFARRKSA